MGFAIGLETSPNKIYLFQHYIGNLKCFGLKKFKKIWYWYNLESVCLLLNPKIPWLG